MKLDTLFPLSLSSSSLGPAWSCETKFFRGQIQHLNRPESDNGDLLAGGLFAKACEEIRVDFYTNDLSEEEALEKAVEMILLAPDTNHPVKTNERVALTFRKYIERFPLLGNFRPCELPDGSHAIEYAFSIDTGIIHPDYTDRTIKYSGIYDGLYEELTNGKVVGRFVVDEKTCGRVSRVQGTKVVDLEKEANIFRLSSQLIGYACYADTIGINIDHAIIRRVPLMTVHEPAFELSIPITPFMKENWKISIRTKIGELVEKYKFYKMSSSNVPLASIFYPSFGGACNAYLRPCRFMEGCLSKDGEVLLEMENEQIVKTKGKDGRWVSIELQEYKQMIKRGEV